MLWNKRDKTKKRVLKMLKEENRSYMQMLLKGEIARYNTSDFLQYTDYLADIAGDKSVNASLRITAMSILNRIAKEDRKPELVYPYISTFLKIALDSSEDPNIRVVSLLVTMPITDFSLVKSEILKFKELLVSTIGNSAEPGQVRLYTAMLLAGILSEGELSLDDCNVLRGALREEDDKVLTNAISILLKKCTHPAENDQ